MSVEVKRLSLTPQQERWRVKYGSWAVVTGASDGIGRAMALCLAEAGLNLVLVARRSFLLEQLASELSDRYGIDAVSIPADLSDETAVDSVLAETSHLDIGLLVACAGFGTAGQFIELPLDRELNMLNVNCRAVLAMSHHFGRRFAQQKRGGMVLMSSLVAFQGVPLSANYAATKAYIQSLAEGLQTELSPFGVDIIASAPGPIHSGFATQADMRMKLALKPDQVAQTTLNALGKRTTVRPGWLSMFLELSLALLPRWGRVRAMGQIMKGMTQHQKPNSNNPSIESM
ncbi:MAG: SDR family NAD(P)-dependent oxidoreductase [Anaerolineaceae bacterium]|nr:SDR family NAD(P)-dependent oxidoreductase [Anaerolineaceae bacterium]